MSRTSGPGRGGPGGQPNPQTAAAKRDPLQYALLPLRGFLGFTFCFAGLQKLANPDFFNAHNPASIQAQLAGAMRHSPIHALLSPLTHQAVAIGVLMALGELAVGLGTLAGLLSKIAAVGGVLISFSLFLTVSFHTSPYYTGSDIVFVFAWLPLLIAGGGPLSLDSHIAGVIAARRRSAGRQAVPLDVQRRQLIAGMVGVLGVAALLGAGVVAGLGRLLHTGGTAPAPADLGAGAPPSSDPASSGASGTAPAASSATGPTRATSDATPTTTRGVTPTATPRATTSPSPKPPAGTKIGPANAVPVKGAASFQDPTSGDPALVVQPKAGTFLAFDAVCPHAGCMVQYDRNNATFSCPCHGSQFNGTTGAVEVGPASRGLTKLHIAEGADGQLYVR